MRGPAGAGQEWEYHSDPNPDDAQRRHHPPDPDLTGYITEGQIYTLDRQLHNRQIYPNQRAPVLVSVDEVRHRRGNDQDHSDVV